MPRRHWLLPGRAKIYRHSFANLSGGLTHATPVLVCCTGLLLTALAVDRNIDAERKTFLAAFQSAARARIAVIQNQLSTSVQNLRAVRAFWEQSDAVTEREFTRFVRTITDGEHSIRFVEWLPRVPAPQRRCYETENARAGRPGRITEVGPDKLLRVAAARPEYYPVTYFVPFGNTQPIFGFDSASNPQGEVAIRAARIAGTITATSKTVLFQDGSTVPSVLLYAAVKRPEGLIAMAVTIPDAIEAALSVLQPADIGVTLEERSESHQSRVLYRGGFKGPLTPSTRPQISEDLVFADKRWSVTCTALTSLDRVGHGWHTLLVGAVGVLLTAILTVSIALILTADRRIQTIVRGRTRRLREATKAARAASAAKSRFIANLGHEVRTPLNGIMGAAQLQRQTASTPEDRENANTLLDASSHLLDVVNDVLDVAKAEAGQIVLRREPMSLRSEVKKACRLYRDIASEKGLRFEWSVRESVPDAVLGDAFRLRQVLLNLVGNAVKFTDAGSVSVVVDAVSSDGTKAKIAFRVRDTGVGLSPTDQSRVFDPFVQVDDRDIRRHQGSGLGLTICKRLVELMDGQIGCESDVGVGSVFWFHLEFTVASSQTLAPSSEEIVISESQSQRCRDRRTRILAAEDNQTNQRILARFLDRLGCDVCMTDNGADAVRAHARDESFDLVLLDLQMPDMDGHEAARIIRGRAGPTLPILAVSASGPRDGPLSSDFNGFLSKPIKLEELAAAIAAFAHAGVEHQR